MSYCTNCGVQSSEADQFCGECGAASSPGVSPKLLKEDVPTAFLEVNQLAVPQSSINGYLNSCPGCKAELVVTAIVCPKCGTAVGTPKDKSVAVLLAVFLTSWTWLYTYKRDAWKFWVGLVLNVIAFITLLFVIGFLIFIGVWLWAVIDTASKPAGYYQRFPNV